MKIKRLFAGVLAVAMTLSISSVAFADDIPEPDPKKQDKVQIADDVALSPGKETEIDYTDNADVAVNISIEASKLTIGDGNLVSLNVPAILPMIFAQDGNTYVPTNWGVTNYDTSNDIDLFRLSITGNKTRLGNKEVQWGLSSITGLYTIIAHEDKPVIRFAFGLADSETLTSVVIHSDAAENLTPEGYFIHASTPRLYNHQYSIKKADESGVGKKTLFKFEVNRPKFNMTADIAGAYTLNLQFVFPEKALLLNNQEIAAEQAAAGTGA